MAMEMEVDSEVVSPVSTVGTGEVADITMMSSTKKTNAYHKQMKDLELDCETVPVVSTGFRKDFPGSAMVQYSSIQASAVVEAYFTDSSCDNNVEFFVEELPKNPQNIGGTGTGANIFNLGVSGGLADGLLAGGGSAAGGGAAGGMAAAKRRKTAGVNVKGDDEGAVEQVEAHECPVLGSDENENAANPSGDVVGEFRERAFAAVLASSGRGQTFICGQHSKQPTNLDLQEKLTAIFKGEHGGEMSNCNSSTLKRQTGKASVLPAVPVEEDKCYWAFQVKLVVIDYAAEEADLLLETCCLAGLRALLSVQLPETKKENGSWRVISAPSSAIPSSPDNDAEDHRLRFAKFPFFCTVPVSAGISNMTTDDDEGEGVGDIEGDDNDARLEIGFYAELASISTSTSGKSESLGDNRRTEKPKESSSENITIREFSTECTRGKLRGKGEIVRAKRDATQRLLREYGKELVRVYAS
eukprot:g8783.t1